MLIDNFEKRAKRLRREKKNVEVKVVEIKQKQKICDNCGKVIEGNPWLYKKKQFCGWKCKSDWMENNTRLRGGKLSQ